MGPIQTLPIGLLGLLQLKTSGGNPSQFSETVSGVYDLGKFYENQQAQMTASLFGAQPTLTTSTRNQPVFTVAATPITVPQKELWYVTEYTIFANLLAAEYVRFAPMWTAPGAIGLIAIGPDVNDVITARARSITSTLSKPFFAGAGSFFGLIVYDIVTAGTIQFNLEMRAVRMPL